MFFSFESDSIPEFRQMEADDRLFEFVSLFFQSPLTLAFSTFSHLKVSVQEELSCEAWESEIISSLLASLFRYHFFLAPRSVHASWVDTDSSIFPMPKHIASSAACKILWSTFSWMLKKTWVERNFRHSFTSRFSFFLPFFWVSPFAAHRQHWETRGSLLSSFHTRGSIKHGLFPCHRFFETHQVVPARTWKA